MKKTILFIIVASSIAHSYSFKSLFKQFENKITHSQPKNESKKVETADLFVPNEPFSPASVPTQLGYGESFRECNSLFPKNKPPAIDLNLAQKSRSLCFRKFAVLYSTDWKSPIYGVEKLSYLNFLSKKTDRSNKFHEELRLKESERSTLEDYKEISKVADRGHIVPSADFVGGSEIENEETFSLSNMAAQNSTLNRGLWAKRVEKAVRQYVERSSGNIYVFTGGFYGKNPKRFGRSKVAVPTFFWKLVYDSEKKKSWAYWVANRGDSDLEVISYEEFVNRTQLKLLD